MRRTLLAAGVLTAAILAAPAAQASFPGRNGLIVFGRYVGSKPGIYVVAANGKHLRRIVAGFDRPFATPGPTWSPDGTHVAYLDDQTKSATPTIRTVTATGGSSQVVVQAQQPNAWLSQPAWTSDGLVSWEEAASQEPSVGGNGVCVQVAGETTPRFCAGLGYGSGSWSSTGGYAWTYWTGNHETLDVVGPGGSETVVAKHGGPFDWSPNGRALVFVAPDPKAPGRMPYQLAVVKANGTGLHLLHVVGANTPEWSPDGKKIVFYDGKGLAIVNANGSHFVQLTHGKYDLQPDWQPR